METGEGRQRQPGESMAQNSHPALFALDTSGLKERGGGLVLSFSFKSLLETCPLPRLVVSGWTGMYSDPEEITGVAS